jgi:transposase
MFFIGIDVHKKQSQICILEEQGQVKFETRVPTTRPDLADVLRSYVPGRVVIEASTPSEWVARDLESLGLEVVVADPNFAPMYATRQKKIKTDRRDARMLADAACKQTYRPAHRISDEKRRLRHELGAREVLVNNRTQLICYVRAQLLGEGLRLPDCAAENLVEHLRQVPLPPPLAATLEPVAQVLMVLNEQIQRQDEQVKSLAHAEPQARLLQTIPRIGADSVRGS